MNYIELLIKYIKHVEFHEGIDYLSDNKIAWSEIEFTSKEVQILKDIKDGKISNFKKCDNCGEMVEMISTGEFCPKCYC